MGVHRALAVAVAVAVAVLVAGAAAMPARQAPGEFEARRRSAIDRSVVRFGRSYPPQLSAADIREAFQRTARRGNNFLRLGRSQPISLTTDDLISLIRSYNEDDDNNMQETKRSPSFLRLGRDPSFIRFGRSMDGDNQNYETTSELILGNGNAQRKNRARDHFLRLGRESEQLDLDDQEERRKRSTECMEC